MSGHRGLDDPAAERLLRLSLALAAAAFLAWLSMGFAPASGVAIVAALIGQVLACLGALASSWTYLRRVPIAAGWRQNVALVVCGGSAAWLLFIILLTGGLLMIGDD